MFGLVIHQIAANGTVPYHKFGNSCKEDVLERKAADKDLKKLLAESPRDTPQELKDIVVEMTKFWPQDRATLGSVKQKLQMLFTSLENPYAVFFSLSSLLVNMPSSHSYRWFYLYVRQAPTRKGATATVRQEMEH